MTLTTSLHNKVLVQIVECPKGSHLWDASLYSWHVNLTKGGMVSETPETTSSIQCLHTQLALVGAKALVLGGTRICDGPALLLLVALDCHTSSDPAMFSTSIDPRITVRPFLDLRFIDPVTTGILVGVTAFQNSVCIYTMSNSNANHGL